MAQHDIEFPKCFSEASYKLRRKFKNVDLSTINDSIQHARIEYWINNIETRIPNGEEALGWFLKVAYRYLYKEIGRSRRYCSLIHEATWSSPINIEYSYICQEIIDSLSQIGSKRSAPTAIKRAMGYSLSELAQSEKLSIAGIKQRQARERRAMRQYYNGVG